MGVQIIRAAAILQLLLGNIGRPGGGIMALRGHASIQGSTDIPTLYDLLPGYLPMPRRRGTRHPAPTTCDDTAGRPVWWRTCLRTSSQPAQGLVRRRATAENDFGFALLPRIIGNHSHFPLFRSRWSTARSTGCSSWGRTRRSARSTPRFERKALARLDWLVVRDLVEIETATFWHDSPEVARGELRPRSIDTEVFLLPAAGHVEKEGSLHEDPAPAAVARQGGRAAGRRAQRGLVRPPAGERLKARAEAEATRAQRAARDAALLALDWWYPEDAHGEPAIEAVLAGDQRLGRGPPVTTASNVAPVRSRRLHRPARRRLDGVRLLDLLRRLRPDGVNRARRREPSGPLRARLGLGMAGRPPHPLQPRVRRPDGRPWSERKKLVWWDAGRRSLDRHGRARLPRRQAA